MRPRRITAPKRKSATTPSGSGIDDTWQGNAMANLTLDELLGDQQEDLLDLVLPKQWYHGAVLWSTDWTTETIVNQLKKKTIDLNPKYQRRNAWDPQRKSLFIESLILGLPVPQIILAEDKNKRGSFIVIDGKQRLLTLRQFAAAPDDGDFTPLRLTGLGDRQDLNGLSYSDLEKNPIFNDELRTFENQTIRTVVIRNWADEQYLYSVFLRINTGSVQLSPQELRQALHPGPFTDFIDDFSIGSTPLKAAMGITSPDFRMRDVELVLRFFAYKNFAKFYAGNLKRFLDETLLELNASWQPNGNDIFAQGGELNAALIATSEIFGERGQLKKWNGRDYERRLNRAVFDIMTYYFSDPQIRHLAVNKKQKVEYAFQNLCATDRDFLSALETTTKSREANSIRFGKWAHTLSGVLGIAIPSPMQ